MFYRYALVVVAAVMVVTIIVAAGMHKTFTMPCKGKIKGIGVGIFWDPNATLPVEYVDWGILEPGETVSEVLYFKSQSNVNITLTMATYNWDPPNATEYMNLSWNYTSQPLTPKSVTPIEMVLHVYSNITGITEFTFDITITGTG